MHREHSLSIRISNGNYGSIDQFNMFDHHGGRNAYTKPQTVQNYWLWSKCISSEFLRIAIFNINEVMRVSKNVIRRYSSLKSHCDQFEWLWEKLMIKTNLLNALKMIKEDKTFNAMLNWIDYMCVCVCQWNECVNNFYYSLQNHFRFPKFSQLRMEPGNSFSNAPPVVNAIDRCRRFISMDENSFDVNRI